MTRRLIALFAAFVLPLAIAYGFFEFARSINVPALRADDPQLGSFVPWCIPLALLVSWIAGKGPHDSAFGGLLGAFVGGIVGFVYFWALLVTTNGLFLAYPFSVLLCWSLGASLALMLAWTPAKPLAWVLDVAAVAGILLFIQGQIAFELRPRQVLSVVFKPGIPQEQVVKEQDRLFMIHSVRGADFAPGIHEFQEASAGPDGIHFMRHPGADTTALAIVFSPHSTSEQREAILRAALSSPVVARVAWAPPGQFEREYAESATDYAKSRGMTGNP